MYQAEGIGQAFGRAAWFLTLLNGYWILLSTQLGLTDAFARTATDILWSASPRVRMVAREDVRRVYLPELRHRVILNFEAQAEQIDTDRVLLEILEKLPEKSSD